MSKQKEREGIKPAEADEMMIYDFVLFYSFGNIDRC